MSEDAGIELWTVATFALAIRRSYPSTTSHLLYTSEDRLLSELVPNANQRIFFFCRRFEGFALYIESPC